MKHRFIKLDLSKQNTLHAHGGIRGENGYIIIAPFNPGLTPSANQKRNKRCMEDLKKANHAHFPVWAGFNVYKNNELKNKRPLMVKAFIILNFPRGLSTAYESNDRLKDLGLELCRKHGQRFYLCKRKEAGDNVYLINSSEQIQRQLNSRSMIESADLYFSNLSDSGLYGKREEKHEFLSSRIYVPATPNSMAESYRRYGEVFIRF